MRTQILVAMPKVPSDPTITPVRSYPGLSSTGPPVRTTRPSGRTNSSPRTWLTVTPYLSVCGPPELVATLPPMVQAPWLDGSGAKCQPCPFTWLVNQRFTTPGSITAKRLRESTGWTFFMRASEITTPPPTGTQPPARLVPAPRGTKGTPSSLHALTTAATCSVVVGKTTTSGTFFSMV